MFVPAVVDGVIVFTDIVLPVFPYPCCPSDVMHRLPLEACEYSTSHNPPATERTESDTKQRKCAPHSKRHMQLSGKTRHDSQKKPVLVLAVEVACTSFH